MKSYMIKLLSLVTMILISATTVFASGGSAREEGDPLPPFGLNVQGDASGTKLEGVIEVSFSDYQCEPYWVSMNYDCDPANAAKAKVSLRLSMTNANNKDKTIAPDGNAVYTKKFYKSIAHRYVDDYGNPQTVTTVPIYDIAKVQEIAIASLKNDVLTAFFGSSNGLYIHLKEISLLTIAKLADEGAPKGYSSLANIILAVNNNP